MWQVHEVQSAITLEVSVGPRILGNIRVLEYSGSNRSSNYQLEYIFISFCQDKLYWPILPSFPHVAVSAKSSNFIVKTNIMSLQTYISVVIYSSWSKLQYLESTRTQQIKLYTCSPFKKVSDCGFQYTVYLLSLVAKRFGLFLPQIWVNFKNQ